ncbi:MAG TPA: hypothetical protein VGD50_00550 [Candidatus Baltobacteraceae bacterium]
MKSNQPRFWTTRTAGLLTLVGLGVVTIGAIFLGETMIGRSGNAQQALPGPAMTLAPIFKTAAGSPALGVAPERPFRRHPVRHHAAPVVVAHAAPVVQVAPQGAPQAPAPAPVLVAQRPLAAAPAPIGVPVVAAVPAPRLHRHRVKHPATVAVVSATPAAKAALPTARPLPPRELVPVTTMTAAPPAAAQLRPVATVTAEPPASNQLIPVQTVTAAPPRT